MTLNFDCTRFFPLLPSIIGYNLFLPNREADFTEETGYPGGHILLEGEYEAPQW